MIAQRYFGSAAPPERIGWGISGYVYVSPELPTVVKIHHHQEFFARELEVYQRLSTLRLTSIIGLNVPRLIDHRPSLRLIEIELVDAPYLLDFAGVEYTPPEIAWEPDRVAQWHEEIGYRFGPNAHIAYAAHHALTRYGMYYMDLRPSNVNLTGFPGVEADPPSEFEDL